MPRARAASVRIREVTTPDDSSLRGAYRLLRTSFHKHERVPLTDWRETLRERVSRVWTDYAWHLMIAEQRGKVIGLATGTYLGNVNVGVIGYLAIDQDAQHSGLGSRLRAKLRDAFRRDARRLLARELKAVIGEVSADNPWLASLSRRPGVLVLDMQYFQPRLSPDDVASPFQLYYESIGRPRRWVSVAELRKVLYAIWRRAYRVARPFNRPAFRKMLRSLAGRRRIGSHPSYRAIQ